MALSEVTCPRCGAGFACGVAAPSCWCSEVELSSQDRDRLSQSHEGCLCRSCLEHISAAKARAVPSAEAKGAGGSAEG